MIDEKITFKQINIAVITLSDTRKESDDKSGNTLKELIQKKGHSVSHYQIIEDDDCPYYIYLNIRRNKLNIKFS